MFIVHASKRNFELVRTLVYISACVFSKQGHSTNVACSYTPTHQKQTSQSADVDNKSMSVLIRATAILDKGGSEGL